MSEEKAPSAVPAFLVRHKVAAWSVVSLALLVGGGLGGVKLRGFVEKRYATPIHPPGIRLVSRPIWMNDALAERIENAARPGRPASAFDHQLLLDVRDQLTSDPDVSPWIEKVVSIRRVFADGPGDTVEVDLQFRAPIAMVKTGNDYWLTDSRCVKLQQIQAADIKKVAFDPQGKPVMRVIDGVSTVVPDLGRPWAGEDVRAGLELLREIYGKKFAEQVVRIDVSNFGGHADANAAQLVLITRFNTEVRWGQPVTSKGYEVSVPQKEANLDKILESFGRIDANKPWIDIRFDKVLFPKVTTPTEPAGETAEAR